MINLLMKKEGSGHLEIIISFILFVGFITFLFYIFNPFNNTSNFDYTGSAYIRMEEMVLTNISSVSLSLDRDLNLLNIGCFSINDPGIIIGLGCNPERQIIVKDKNGNNVDASINFQTSTINIDVSDIQDDVGKRFYNIYCSSELFSVSTSGECTLLNNQQYLVGIVNKRELWSKTKLEAFYNEYLTNYTELKKNIVPEGNDFNFIIYEFGGNKVFDGNKIPSRNLNVFSNKYSIDVLDENGNIVKYIMTLIVW
ncbi:MAG: hypothetical protein QXI33_02370 [Candidatus Pacearchaeota archaeon]